MTKGLGLRQYRACVRCRSRKTRCDLRGIGDPNKPPCVKCNREGAECVLATSRRGGDYSHLRRQKRHSTQRQENEVSSPPVLSISSPGNGSLHSTSRDHVHDSLQNPSDALLILANAAGQPDDQIRTQADSDNPYLLGANSRNAYVRIPGNQPIQAHGRTGVVSPNAGDRDPCISHTLIDNGTIPLPLLLELLSSYRDSYHQFFPIVPKSVLNPDNIQETVQQEPFLTAAILAVATKDGPDQSTRHNTICDHLRQRMLDVVLGVPNTRHVGCVEGLLLLGEWTLLNLSQADDGGGEAAWSIIGLAVRLAYRLRLEDSGFRGQGNELDAMAQRKRLAWTLTYLSDRQISIRMGQAFWCRGPALSVRFIAQDFPSLQPQSKPPFCEDYASWIQAQVELTTLFGNAHDILFASKSRTVELITRGDYVKYIDDTGKAMAAWQCAWRGIAISSALSGCLTIMLEYLRLYVNAFAFQAVLYRVSRPTFNTNSSPAVRVQDGQSSSKLYFPDSTMASADARHIYEALDAAESLLRVFTEEFDETQLRCMPTRFYLYEIHSAVFLYKAHASGAIPQSRYAHTKSLIQRFIAVLQSTAMSENHIASRYARLLYHLWFQQPHSPPEDPIPDSSGIKPNADNPLGMVGGPVGDVSYGASLFDDTGLGPDALEGSEWMDSFLSMPPAFPYDLSMFLRQAEGGEFPPL